MFHSMVRVKKQPGMFECKACFKQADLNGAIEHAVSNQITIQPPKVKVVR